MGPNELEILARGAAAVLLAASVVLGLIPVPARAQTRAASLESSDSVLRCSLIVPLAALSLVLSAVAGAVLTGPG